MKLTGHVKHLGMHTTHTTHSCRHEEIYYLPVSPTKFLDSHVDFPSTLSFQLLSKGICFLHHCCIELLRVGSSDYSGTSMRATTSVVGIKLWEGRKYTQYTDHMQYIVSGHQQSVNSSVRACRCGP